MAVKPVGEAVNVNPLPEGTAAVGAPVIVALKLVGVSEDAPAILPAPAAGAAAVSRVARLAVGVSSYEYVGVNTRSVPVSVVPVVPVNTLPIERIKPPLLLLSGLARLVNWLYSTKS